MDTAKIEKTIVNMNKEIDEIRSKYQAQMQEIFKSAFKQFFEANPSVTCISWRQYTPYFNDGDECVFSCYAEYASFTNAEDYTEVKYGEYDGENPETVWISDNDYGDYNEHLISADVNKNAKAFRRILGMISDSVFKDMFGDHCIVYATRDGFEVAEYEHN